MPLLRAVLYQATTGVPSLFVARILFVLLKLCAGGSLKGTGEPGPHTCKPTHQNRVAAYER